MKEVHHYDTNHEHNTGHKHVVRSTRHDQPIHNIYSSIPIVLEEPKLEEPEVFEDLTIVLVVGAISTDVLTIQ